MQEKIVVCNSRNNLANSKYQK